MAKKKSSSSKSEKRDVDGNVNFEKVLAEVEQIVGRLERGELDLTESLEQYEIGVRQLKNCHSMLGSAERRVTLLSGFDADGNAVTEPMPGLDSGNDADAGNGANPRSPSVTPPPGPKTARGESSTMDDSPGLF